MVKSADNDATWNNAYYSMEGKEIIHKNERKEEEK